MMNHKKKNLIVIAILIVLFVANAWLGCLLSSNWIMAIMLQGFILGIALIGMVIDYIDS